MIAKKVLLVIAHVGYQPMEYEVPKKVIESAGYKVVTASNKKGKATASNGATAPVDLTVADAQVRDYDAIAFIGGPGALDNLDNEQSYELVRQAFNQEKIVGAICISPRILAKAGVLANVAATGWDEDSKLAAIFDEYDANYVKAPVVVDQNIVTAVGPMAAQNFGEEIVRLLKKKQKLG